jgi:predicted pyridoxine 5'-phosphate oxidase superfamily flavin-nucleotide-binding protein
MLANRFLQDRSPMTLPYSSAARELQDRFDTRRLADRLVQVTVHDRFTADDREYIEQRDMFFLASVDATGQPTCSYKGGDPGFVRVVDDRTLVFPNYDGNGMYLSMGNVAATHRVGLLFIDFEGQDRMRVEGSATLAFDDPLVASYPEAQFIVRVAVDRIYPNCPRYIHHYRLVERSAFVPRPTVPTPVPGWKQSHWAADVLPAGDPARRRR